MAQKTSFVRARIEPKLKVEAEHVLDELGITPTEAVRMLYKSIAREHGWPIELKLPNVKTRRVLRDTDKGKGLNKAKDADDLFNQLGI